MLKKDKIIELIKNNIVYVLIIFIPLIILFFMIKNFDYSTVEKAVVKNDGYTDFVILGRNFSQDFYVTENNLRQINLYCGTYGQVIDSTLDVKITDKETNEIIFDNKIHTATIADNSTTPIYFEIQENSRGKWYNIDITCVGINSLQGLSFALIKLNEKNEVGIDLTPSYIYSEKNDGVINNDISQDLSFKIDYVYANTNIKLLIIKNSILILAFIITIGMCFLWINKNNNIEESQKNLNEKIQNICNIFILLFFVIVVFIWITSNKVITNHPDEIMRMSLPFYIYENNKLPLPRDPDVLSSAFNASYAYYPLFLTSIIAAVFMKVATIFGFTSNFELVVAMRMVSLLSGLVSVIFLMKICKKLFKKDIIVRNLVVIFGAFIPQFIYLSSYFNNDIPAVCASAIMVYVWILGLENGWNVKRAILLAIGIIICALSYYNAYSWILLSGVVFIISFIKKIENKKNDNNVEIKVEERNKLIEKINDNKFEFDYKNFFKFGIMIVIIVLIFISYFFIRNIIILDGDMLGIKSFLASCEEGDNISQRLSERDTPKNLGYSYWYMINSSEWIGMPWYKSTYQSFICSLGGNTERISNWVYELYMVIFGVGLISFIIKLIVDRKKISNTEKILYISLFFASVIVVCLSLKYSHDTDYQPQGRYIYPIWIALMIFVGKGFEFVINVFKRIIKKENVIKLIEIISALIVVILILFIQLKAIKINVDFQSNMVNIDISDFDRVL